MELTTLLVFLLAAFVVAAIVVASGFGLGTTLTPLFLVVYDIKTAVLLVAVVHLANNLFKLFLFRHQVDHAVVRRFGLLSVAGAIVGSLLQSYADFSLLEIGLGVLLITLGGMEFLPGERRWTIPRRIDPIGGLLSGLLGGLLGNQGALRSGYLLNYRLPKEAFIATGTAIACLIDLSRIPIYLFNYHEGLLAAWPYLTAIVLAAVAGTWTGKSLVTRLPLSRFRFIVGVMVVAAGFSLLWRNFV